MNAEGVWLGYFAAKRSPSDLTDPIVPFADLHIIPRADLGHLISKHMAATLGSTRNVPP